MIAKIVIFGQTDAISVMADLICIIMHVQTAGSSRQWSNLYINIYIYNSVLAKPIAACTHLSATVSQLFEPQVQKIAIFTYRIPHFCFSWRSPCDYHAICSMDRKTIQCLPNPSQHVPIYLEYFPSSTMLKSMRKSKKLLFLPHFGSPWGRPWGNHAIRDFLHLRFE